MRDARDPAGAVPGDVDGGAVGSVVVVVGDVELLKGAMPAMAAMTK
jgi:hypothetical protein